MHERNDEVVQLRRRIAELEARNHGELSGAARENEKRYRTLFETMAQGVVYQAADGCITSANPAAERILGLSLDQMQGRTSMDPRWRAIHEDGSDFPGEQHPAMEAIRTGKPVHNTLMGVFHPLRNEYRWILIDAVPEFLPGEAEAYQVYATFTDITERRNSEQELLSRTDALTMMLEVSRSLAASLEPKAVLQATTDGITRLSGLDSAAVYLLDGDLLRLGGTTPPLPPNFPEELRIAPLADHPHIGRAVASGQPVFVPDLAQAELTPAEQSVVEQRGLRTALFLPLISGEKTAGVLIVNSVGLSREWSPAVLDLCRTLANLAALAVENARLYDSIQQHTAALVRQVAERKHADEALHQSEERLRLALTAAKQGLYDLNVQTGEAVVTPEYALMLGYVPDEFIETNAKWIERLHPDDRVLVADTYRDYVGGALPEYRVEFRQKTKSGEWKWILSIGKIVEYDAAGNPLRMLGTHTDITDRKEAEQERLELERRLLHSQKLESLGVLAGGIAHDFNNLLMAVLGNLDLALRSISPVSPARANIEQSAQAARRATDLTRQMLAYSGKGRFVVKPLNVTELVEENVHLLRASITRTAVLDLHLDRSLPRIEADPGQVQQVIMNLIINASEAIGDEPGRITITTGVRDCDAQCLKQSRLGSMPVPGRFIVLEVSDTGCGMDADTQERLFDPFFSTKALGRGLGMPAILGIVRGHRGALFVESTPGEGTTIRILFPELVSQQVAQEAPAAAAREAGPVAGTVLVVDDEEMVRKVCSAMVQSLGAQVLTAVDGREAVDLFANKAAEISHVILDLTMPNMDGMTAYQELARIKPDVHVIFSSGYDERESIQRMLGAERARFIQKPYTLDSLRAALDRQ